MSTFYVDKQGNVYQEYSMKNSSPVDQSILDKPYSDRQLVIVADDEIVTAARKAEHEALLDKNDINWQKIGEVALHAFLGGTPYLIAEVAKEAIKAWSRARAKGINILAVKKSEATKISFPPGHPRDGVLYIGHPAMPNVYYTTAEFHRVTFEHKFAEAIDLLMNLGATKIRVEHITGWSKEFSSKVNTSLDESKNSIDGEIDSSKNSSSALLYEATFDGAMEPRIPDGLVWYPHEATWQIIAKGRKKFGLRNFSLSLTYEDDFGVNAGLKAAILKSGLNLGGKFEDHRSTVWRLTGEFSARRSE